VRGPSCISVECVNREHSGRIIIGAREGISAKFLGARGQLCAASALGRTRVGPC
jgi:hypothetical protein